jgi:hypothetical protein
MKLRGGLLDWQMWKHLLKGEVAQFENFRGGVYVVVAQAFNLSPLCFTDFAGFSDKCWRGVR